VMVIIPRSPSMVLSGLIAFAIWLSSFVGILLFINIRRNYVRKKNRATPLQELKCACCVCGLTTDDDDLTLAAQEMQQCAAAPTAMVYCHLSSRVPGLLSLSNSERRRCSPGRHPTGSE
jgi:hypothetical protein